MSTYEVNDEDLRMQIYNVAKMFTSTNKDITIIAKGNKISRAVDIIATLTSRDAVLSIRWHDDKKKDVDMLVDNQIHDFFQKFPYKVTLQDQKFGKEVIENEPGHTVVTGPFWNQHREYIPKERSTYLAQLHAEKK
ncbi:MAG: hypothetical protein KGH64_04700 [Candidatus Micrarchaeota archaeon]|nr:hypothetical protein [Candidatus Micrarchaeota archaeon]MDE1834611.1 hypothetical protein [Candidatus Micrarchaeota archaeon]